MADNLEPIFQIQRVYLKDLSLEQPNSPAIFLDQQQPQDEAGALGEPRGEIAFVGEVQFQPGMWIGVKLARRIQPQLFYRLVYLGMFLTGSKLVWDALH